MGVITIGDLLLDVIVRIDELIAPDADTYGTIEISAGGQAANVGAWVAELGGSARLACAHTDDPSGRLLADELRRRGGDLVGPTGRGRAGAVVSLTRASGEWSMLTDRGTATTLESSQFEDAWLEGFEWLYGSGYALAAGPVRFTRRPPLAMPGCGRRSTSPRPP